jgi:hypothetical protein
MDASVLTHRGADSLSVVTPLLVPKSLRGGGIDDLDALQGGVILFEND